MREEMAERQERRMEMVLTKALLNLNIVRDEAGAVVVANIAGALLEAYHLGGLEAVEHVPFEATEVAYRDNATPEVMRPMLHQGWEPWALTQVMIPADPRPGSKNKQSSPGWLVKFKRRMKPTAPMAPENDNGH